MTGIDHQPLKIRLVNQALEQRFPNATIAPAAEASMGVLPVAISGRQVTPRSAGSQNPKDGIDELAIVLGNAAPLPRLSWQMRFEQSPISIRKIVAAKGFLHRSGVRVVVRNILTFSRDDTT